jgi:hypothetical protein
MLGTHKGQGQAWVPASSDAAPYTMLGIAQLSSTTGKVNLCRHLDVRKGLFHGVIVSARDASRML